MLSYASSYILTPSYESYPIKIIFLVTKNYDDHHSFHNFIDSLDK